MSAIQPIPEYRGVALRGRAKVWRAMVRLLPALLHAALAGGTAADEAKERLFIRLLGGLPVEQVRPIRDEIKRLVDELVVELDDAAVPAQGRTR